jgi:hypothetical protein
MGYIWFKKAGRIYQPSSVIGWAIAIITIFLCIQVFIAVDVRFHSVSDTFYGIFPYIVAYLVVAGGIASNTSE